MKTLTVLLVVSLLLPSCAYHIGTVGGGSAVVTDANFSHVDFAYGTARTVHVFGIGGSQKDALVLEAKRNLYLNYKLQPKQAIGQTVVDFKRTIFFPLLFTKVTVSAEIIDFSSEQVNTGLTKDNLNRFAGSSPSGGYTPGDTVGYLSRGDTLEARVLNLKDRGNKKSKYTIQYYDRKNRFKVKKVTSSRLRYPQRKRSQKGKPLELKHHARLYTPLSPKNELVRFRYNDEEYTGELLNQLGDTYTIGMQSDTGKKVGIRIKQENVIR